MSLVTSAATILEERWGSDPGGAVSLPGLVDG